MRACMRMASPMAENAAWVFVASSWASLRSNVSISPLRADPGASAFCGGRISKELQAAHDEQQQRGDDSEEEGGEQHRRHGLADRHVAVAAANLRHESKNPGPWDAEGGDPGTPSAGSICRSETGSTTDSEGNSRLGTA